MHIYKTLHQNYLLAQRRHMWLCFYTNKSLSTISKISSSKFFLSTAEKFRTQNSTLLKFQSFCEDGAQVAAVSRPKVSTASFSALPIAFFHQQHIHDTKNFYASCVLKKFVVRHKTNTKFIHAWYFMEILNTNVPRNWMQ